MDRHRVRFDLARYGCVATLALFFLACSGTKVPQITTDASSGPGAATPTPAPVSTGPKNVTINWGSSHAKDVGLTGGGYKVWVHLNTAPTTTNTTPVVIVNPGGGTHVTTSTVNLSPGRYYVSVSSYSTNGDSPLSTPTIVVVP